VQQMVFSLPDEAAECRYVQRLLEAAQAALQGAQRLRTDAEALAASGHREDAARKMMAALAVISGLTQDDLRRTIAATQATESKHGHLPSCAVPLNDQGQRGLSDASTLSSEYAARVREMRQWLPDQ